MPLSLHTSRGRVADIVARAQREHPYEVPGVSARPIIDGSPDYLAWIAKETETDSGRARGPAT
jgi:periplasmic divalent cation tolerance protein